MKKILVTGANGFIGRNLILNLENLNDIEIFKYDIDTGEELLDKYTKECDFVYHLAGVNRPQNDDEFMKGNFGFTSILLDKLEKNKNKSPILITSSIQAELDNAYGKSKKAGEDLIFEYSKKNNVRVCVYRFPNVFGKWCRPNYNSVIATFCYNIANNLEITVNDPDTVLNLVYIDDVCKELITALFEKENRIENYCYVPIVSTEKLGNLANIIKSFRDCRNDLYIPNMQNSLVKKLYSTYLSYLPENNFSYDLKMNVDDRGSFTELFKSLERGQVSVNISKPGIVKGNHWHNTKNEKFVVVSGEGIIRFRKLNCDEIIEYKVCGDKLQIVDIPCGYTHNIENTGKKDMVTIMWANEVFNKDDSDTYYLNV